MSGMWQFGWESTKGMKSRTRRIDEATAQAILNLKGTMGPTAAAESFNDPRVTVNIVKSIWRRLRWTHLRQQNVSDNSNPK